MKVTSLRCEYLENPLAIEAKHPRLEWRLAAEGRGRRQTAYRVLVASSRERLKDGEADLWDSGRVESDRTSQIEYAGKPLAARRECWWKVRIWDEDGKASGWSKPAQWRMGLLSPSDWKADWISHRDTTPVHQTPQQLHLPAPRRFRTEFAAEKKVRSAVLYATALGIADFSLNGKPVSDEYFAPGWSDYKRRVHYRAYDVTRLLTKGSNALAAELAEGWYSGYLGYGLLVGYGPYRTGRSFYGKTPAVRAQLEIEYSDGSRQVVTSNSDWRVTDRGPTREADMLMGEVYDARQELAGWDRTGFDASAWQKAVRASENVSVKAPYFDSAGRREIELGFVPPAEVQAYPGVPVRETGEVPAVAITEPKPGVYIFNLGQNFAGVARLKVKGPAGTTVKLRFGEMVHPDGRLMTENLRRARATDTYTLKGDPKGETWTPRFTYHGFQYVEVTGYPGKPALDAITGIALNSDTPLTSEFESSDPVLNRLFKNVVWTQRANFIEVPTDCPQRDERLGWMGDAQIYARAATYHADTAAFYTKWLDDVAESQLPNGAYPDYAPYPMFHGGPTGYGTAWTDAGIIVPYTVWQVYGDTAVLKRHWDSMKRFIDFRVKRDPEMKGTALGNNWGDWLSLGEQTPIELVDLAYFAQSARLMSGMAQALGKTAEADGYRSLFRSARASFQKLYLLPEGELKVPTQTAYTLALSFDLLPLEARKAAETRLADRIRANDTRMATGFLGTRPLLPVLTEGGHHELAVRLMQSRRFPSWGYEVVNGATSIWERWNSFTKEGGFGDAGMNSFSHYSFGAVSEWMFQSLAGIDTDGPGYRKLVLRPGPPRASTEPGAPHLDAVRAAYDSPSGRIAVDWRRTGDRFDYTVTVPPNVSATLFLPSLDSAAVRESGKALGEVEGVKQIRQAGDRTVLELQSGVYRFSSTWK